MIALVVFAASVLIAAYVLIGYPLLLGVWARYRARPVAKASIQPRVTFVIAVFNGERYLAEKLRSVLALDYPRDRMQILVVSDGSTDETENIARDFATHGVELLVQPRGGKPAALNFAVPHATGEILILTDVRQELAADSVAKLVESFADPRTGTVSGELLIRKGGSQEESDIGLYWRIESWIRDRLASIDSMFGATGPFYAIRRELYVPIPGDTLLDDMYLPLSAFRRGYRLVVDTRARAYDYPTSRATEFQRKVRTLAGNYQILTVFPWLLGPGNRMWFHFVSYKAGRLLLPWCLIGAGASSFFLPDSLRAAALAAQGLFYALAAVDGMLPASFPLKKLSSPARTFVTMMIAALRGLSVFFVPARSLWKVTSASSDKSRTAANSIGR